MKRQKTSSYSTLNSLDFLDRNRDYRTSIESASAYAYEEVCRVDSGDVDMIDGDVDMTTDRDDDSALIPVAIVSYPHYSDTERIAMSGAQGVSACVGYLESVSASDATHHVLRSSQLQVSDTTTMSNVVPTLTIHTDGTVTHYPADASLMKDNALKAIRDGVRFIVSFIGISIERSQTNHMNAVVYDVKFETLERYEPLGWTDRELDLVDREIQGHFERLFDRPNLTYFASADYAPQTQVQNYTEQHVKSSRATKDVFNFCVIWSTWWMDLRLSNPDLSREDMAHGIMHEARSDRFYLAERIQSYAGTLNAIRTKRASSQPFKYVRIRHIRGCAGGL
jgi:hypothetical protein